MTLRTYEHARIPTRNQNGDPNGYLIPIYNLADRVFARGEEPAQVYVTSILVGQSKGPHLHHIRRGYFTCIRGDVKIVVKSAGGYQEYFSGENHSYRSIEIPTGLPALIENVSDVEALVINMPFPAWTPSMNDEETADFSDYRRDA